MVSQLCTHPPLPLHPRDAHAPSSLGCAPCSCTLRAVRPRHGMCLVVRNAKKVLIQWLKLHECALREFCLNHAQLTIPSTMAQFSQFTMLCSTECGWLCMHHSRLCLTGKRHDQCVHTCCTSTTAPSSKSSASIIRCGIAMHLNTPTLSHSTKCRFALFLQFASSPKFST